MYHFWSKVHQNLDVLAAPFQDIGVEAIAKELDYEGELCVIIGKDVKNLPENADPFDYILGYTVGNDVSSRYWQWTHMSGAQHGYAKSFDGFAPIGPVIASRAAVPNPDKLKLKTWVNGQLKQNNSTDNMIFGISAIIRHLSQGITLKKGTIIMTGTPE
jgi:2-keto-4-pentenoate hydratase/2-oxohepta-3-ene-1,7-dioic acid hydratase in catechol pathway